MAGCGRAGVETAGRLEEAHQAATGPTPCRGGRVDDRGPRDGRPRLCREPGATGERVSWTGIRRKDGDDTMGWRIGVDIGGTFTDVAVLDETSGRAGIAKVSTTPRDFGAAVIEGTRAAMDELPHRARNGLAPLARHHHRHQCPPRIEGRQRRARRHPRPFATCSSSGAPPARISTTSSRTRRRCSFPAAGGSRSPSESMPRARSSPPSTKRRSIRSSARSTASAAWKRSRCA